MDVLGAIYEARGKRKPPRASADRSIRTTGHLLDYDAGSWLATVSVHNSAPISGVPATPADYVGLGITTVSVLLDPETGRPVQVLGPASDVAVGGAGGVAPPPGAGGARVVRGRVFLPVDTGTWDTDAEAWDMISSYGGLTNAWQETVPGVNLVPNPNPTTEDAGWGGAYGPFDDWWCEYDGDNDPVWYTESMSYINLAYGPASMETPSCFSGYRGRIFPVRRDMTAIPASAGASYQVAADGLVAITAGEPGTFSIGVDWLDSAGDFISTSESTPVVKGVDEGPEWLYGPGDRTWRPEDTFTSPAGTEYAAPFIRMGAGTVDTPDCYAANFFFGVSA